jgi:quercetin dioxygenase-like cupin family protein
MNWSGNQKGEGFENSAQSPYETLPTVNRIEKLANAPGKTLTVVNVNYAPGGKSGKHHHAGSVFAYVLSGAIRSQNSATGPVKVYRTGESFFEPSGSQHLVSENASATEPASLLAVFVADDGARLTTFDK